MLVGAAVPEPAAVTSDDPLGEYEKEEDVAEYPAALEELLELLEKESVVELPVTDSCVDDDDKIDRIVVEATMLLLYATLPARVALEALP